MTGDTTTTPAPATTADRQASGLGHLTAVVVTYRNEADVVGCVTALRRALDGLPSEVVLVDNHSDDATVATVRGAFPDVRVVERYVNDGFGRGCHVGADSAAGEWLLFVNPDAVIAPDAVGALLATAARFPKAGVLGGRALRRDGTTDPRSWWGRPTLWSSFCFATGLNAAFAGHPLFDTESPDRWDGQGREVPVVSGALMLVDRRAWEQLGGFDPDFLLYGEDVDFCLRARRAGWRPRVVPEATFTHAVGGSTSGPVRTVLVMRGRATVLRRHLPRGVRWLGGWLLVTGVGLRALMGGRGRTRRQASTDVTAWQAAWHARSSWRHGWRPTDRLEALP